MPPSGSPLRPGNCSCGVFHGLQGPSAFMRPSLVPGVTHFERAGCAFGQALLIIWRVPNQAGPGGDRGDGRGLGAGVDDFEPAHHHRPSIEQRVNSYGDGAHGAGQFQGHQQAVRIVNLRLLRLDPAPGSGQVLPFHGKLEAVNGQACQMLQRRCIMELRLDDAGGEPIAVHPAALPQNLIANRQAGGETDSRQGLLMDVRSPVFAPRGRCRRGTQGDADQNNQGGPARHLSARNP